MNYGFTAFFTLIVAPSGYKSVLSQIFAIVEILGVSMAIRLFKSTNAYDGFFS